MYQLSQDAKEFIASSKQELTDLVLALCAIPAPSNHEEQRAAFCKKWLEDAGAKGVYIDEALNVVFPIHAEASDRLTVFVAHTDTVFPEMEPLPMEIKDGVLHCPGAGDDTANVAILLLLAKYMITRNIQPKDGFLLVCGSGEEALGNLKGIKQIMKDYAGRIQAVYAYDGLYNQIVNWPLATVKYRVEIHAQGGHAYLNFGNPSAIVCAAGIVNDLYQLPIPEGCKSFYNAGVWTGGEAPNGIAQHSELLIELRSQMNQNLKQLTEDFLAIVEKYKNDGRYEILVEQISDIPGQEGVDPEAQKKMDRQLEEILTHYCGEGTFFRCGTGDINIPMSMGIPGIGFCGYKAAGYHTRQETLELESLTTGLAVNLTVMLDCAQEAAV